MDKLKIIIMDSEQIKKYVQKWIDSHEPDTFIKSTVENEEYWYTSKNGVSSINIAYFFRQLLEDFIEDDEVVLRQPDVIKSVCVIHKNIELNRLGECYRCLKELQDRKQTVL